MQWSRQPQAHQQRDVLSPGRPQEPASPPSGLCFQRPDCQSASLGWPPLSPVHGLGVHWTLATVCPKGVTSLHTHTLCVLAQETKNQSTTLTLPSLTAERPSMHTACAPRHPTPQEQAQCPLSPLVSAGRPPGPADLAYLPPRLPDTSTPKVMYWAHKQASWDPLTCCTRVRVCVTCRKPPPQEPCSLARPPSGLTSPGSPPLPLYSSRLLGYIPVTQASAASVGVPSLGFHTDSTRLF